MPRYLLTDRINAAKRFGLTKIEVVPGAQTKGSDAYGPGCYVGHHTAGPKIGDRPSLGIVVNGRGGANPLSGPLANDFMPRSGGLVIVACGRSNNAGAGGFRGITGNSGTIGCEAEDDGDGTWTGEQWRDYPRIVASGLWMIGRDQTWYCSHRTWAPTRKIDPTGVADQWMQAWVRVLLHNPKAVPRQGMPTATDLIGDPDVPLTPGEWDKLYSIVYRVVLAAQTGKPNTVVNAADAALLKPASELQTYELIAYGDSRDDTTDKNAHPNNLQRVRFEMAQDRAVTAETNAIVKQIAAALPAAPTDPTPSA